MAEQQTEATEGAAYSMQALSPSAYDRDREVAAWDAQAAEWSNYDTFSDMVAERLRAAVPDLAERRLIDWGCGSGALLALLAPHCASALGLDISPAMVDQATARLAAADLSDKATVRCLVVDDETVQEFEGSAGLLVSGSVLHCVPDPADMVRVLARAVAPGGVVAHYVWQAAEVPAEGEAFEFQLHEGLTAPVLQSMLEAAGLQGVAVEAIDFHGMVMLEAVGRKAPSSS